MNMIDAFQEIIGYKFKDSLLLQTALTHKSFLRDSTVESKVHNERLEFLGDAVIELVVSDFLYTQLNIDEGRMTTLRSKLVSRANLFEVGKSCRIQDVLNVGKTERSETNGIQPSIISNAFEALVGAVYQDSGLESAKKIITKFILNSLPILVEQRSIKDPKTQLQELVQRKYKETPKYKTMSSEGKDHNKVFVCGVEIKEKVLATGEGKTKQTAENEAALKALTILKFKKKSDKVFLG
jgi:ribonuclease III